MKSGFPKHGAGHALITMESMHYCISGKFDDVRP